MLATAIEAEVAEYIHPNREYLDKEGKRLVVRNGHARRLMPPSTKFDNISSSSTSRGD